MGARVLGGRPSQAGVGAARSAVGEAAKDSIAVAAGANVRRKGTLSGALFRMARTTPGWSTHTRTCSRDEVVALLTASGYAVIEETLLPGALALLARRRPATSLP